MSSPQRRSTSGVIHQLLQQPQQFDFLQAVRLLDRWLDGGFPAGRGLARVRFRNAVSLSFPASDIEALVVHAREDNFADLGAIPATAIDRVEVTPAFMGLLGVSGALPLCYTEAIGQRELYQKDTAARAFLDVFTHRSVVLFYDAWRKHRLPIDLELTAPRRFRRMILSLGGLNAVGERPRGGAERVPAISAQALAYYGGALRHQRWSAVQAQRVLAEYFGLPVHIEQFVGRWYALPELARARLGVQVAGQRTQGVLGKSALLGERVWQRNLCLRVELGPLPHARLQGFLPESRGARALSQWLTLCFGTGLTFEVRLRLDRAHIEPTVLHSGRDSTRSRLGWDTFLQTRPSTADRGDIRYELHPA